MKINVRNINGYLEMKLKDGNTTIETGLMTKEESYENAIAFLRAAEDLLPDSVERDKLIQIQEVL